MASKSEVKEQTAPVLPTAHMSKSMEEIRALVKARTPIIYVVTHEETRFINEFKSSVADDPGVSYGVFCWTSNLGLMTFENRKKAVRVPDSGDDPMAGTARPDKALNAIKAVRAAKEKNQNGVAFILQDFHQLFVPPVVRQIRDMIDDLCNSLKTIIITAPTIGAKGAGLPEELEKDIVLVHYNLPDRATLRQITLEQTEIIACSIREKIEEEGKDSAFSKINTLYTEDEIYEITRAAQGLTVPELNNALATSFIRNTRVLPDYIRKEKEQLVKKTAILECVQAGVKLEDIGGMDIAKDYFLRYSKAFSDEAKKFGVEAPTGFLLTGVPGVGKSLFAKALASLWKLPLLRLDIGKVMTGLVGGSEEGMRRAIQSAEAMSPAILWIDEVEKAVGGVKSSHQSDSGTLARVFGTLLTWMQEKQTEVPVIATANDFSLLPPEFIRRFSETFFMDIPTEGERHEIWRIHISKPREGHPGRDPKKYDLDKLTLRSQYYTGAEIEKCVKAALVAAFAGGAKELTQQHLENAIAETKPLYKVMGEKVQELRTSARGRFVYASSSAAAEAGLGKQIIKTDSGATMSLEDIEKDLGSIELKPKETNKKSSH